MSSSDSDSIKLFEDGVKSNTKKNSNSGEETSSSPETFQEKSNSNKGKGKAAKSGKEILFYPTALPPPVAVPEKIFFCIDNSSDKGIGYVYSIQGNETIGPEPWCIRNQAITTFIANKQAVASQTEFAIAAVEPGKVKMLKKLCNDDSVLESLSGLKGVDIENISDYDITPIFDLVLKSVKIPQLPVKVEVIPPEYIIRIIFIYGNSYREPKINTDDLSYNVFMKSPYCTLDILFLHEKQSDFNNVVDIFKALEDIVSPRSYVLECSRDVTSVFNNMAKLLAHPCQRVPQHMWPF